MCGYAVLLSKIEETYYILPNLKFGGVESLYKIKLKAQKIDYQKETIKQFLQKFYDIGNKSIKPEERHRFKKLKIT